MTIATLEKVTFRKNEFLAQAELTVSISGNFGCISFIRLQAFQRVVQAFAIRTDEILLTGPRVSPITTPLHALILFNKHRFKKATAKQGSVLLNMPRMYN